MHKRAMGATRHDDPRPSPCTTAAVGITGRHAANAVVAFVTSG
jgi:hypothetical protein